MKKRILQMITVGIIFAAVLTIHTAVHEMVTGAAAKVDARIVDYDSGSKTERFHYGRDVGQTVNISVRGDKESIKVTNVTITSADTTVCSVTKTGGYYTLHFLKEGTSVITMKCKADGNAVEKRLLASCLTKTDTTEAVLKQDSIVYRGCSDREGISSKNTEVKDRIEYEEDITIDGMCGNYYRIWLEDDTFGDSGENWGYVKKQDVIIPLEDIEIPKELNMYEDTQQYMDVKYIPNIAPIIKITWKSSNTNVVKVDAQGKLTAGKRGSAVVTMIADSSPAIQKQCRVTVKPYIPVTGIKITPDKTETDNGVLGKISVEIIPSDASVQDFTWHVDNDDVLQVDPKGRYMGKKPGIATVTVTTVEGKFTDSCSITVLPVKVAGVSVQKEAEINVNEVCSLVWNTVPTNATNKHVTWKSSNESVVRVDKFGNVRGVSLGSADIYVTTEEGNYTDVCRVTVSKFVNDIHMAKNYFKLKPGKTKKIKIKIEPADCTKKDIVWRTDNSEVVSVTAEGVIKANKPGRAKIIVYDRYTGAFDFALIRVTAGFQKPKLKFSGKKTLTWKKQQYATKYVVYEKEKGAKKFKKKTEVKGNQTKCTLSSVKKQNQYKIRCYCKENQEYSKYSNIAEVK